MISASVLLHQGGDFYTPLALTVTFRIRLRQKIIFSITRRIGAKGFKRSKFFKRKPSASSGRRGRGFVRFKNGAAERSIRRESAAGAAEAEPPEAVPPAGGTRSGAGSAGSPAALRSWRQHRRACSSPSECLWL